MNGYKQGNLTESAVIRFLLKRGFEIALPVGVHRYDLVVKFGNEFLRTQIKTGHRENGSLSFKTSTNSENGIRHGYTKEEIDVFLVYDSTDDKLYKVPIFLVDTNCEFYLRLEELKRKNKRTHWAKEFEV